MQGLGRREDQIQAGSPGTVKLEKHSETRKTLRMQCDTNNTQPSNKGPLRLKTGALNKIIKHRCIKSTIISPG